MKYYIKVITGFRDDQVISIPMQEAHKAYYLFKHPTERGVFENGLALIGSQIQQILPDYQKTMGWNPTHKLSDDDWLELRANGVEEKMKVLLEKASDVSLLAERNSSIIKLQLSDAIKQLPAENKHTELNEGTTLLADKFKV